MLYHLCFCRYFRVGRQNDRRTPQRASALRIAPLRIAPLFLALLLLLGNGSILHPRPLFAQIDGEQEPEQEPEAAQVTPKIFLPLVAIEQNIERVALTCSPSEPEQQLAQLLKNDPAQGRRAMRCNPLLQQVARARAEDMARRGYFAHTDPDGYGPNYHVLQAGYELPEWYDHSDDANGVESLGAGYTEPAEVLAAWKVHPPHNAHPLGLLKFHADQTEYGIGHYHSDTAPYREYWVLITAPPLND